jgi:hypothetical protein
LAEELVKEIVFSGCRYKYPREEMITYRKWSENEVDLSIRRI